jgi:hypothetical protein
VKGDSGSPSTMPTPLDTPATCTFCTTTFCTVGVAVVLVGTLHGGVFCRPTLGAHVSLCTSLRGCSVRCASYEGVCGCASYEGVCELSFSLDHDCGRDRVWHARAKTRRTAVFLDGMM